jgi:Xaa-Pro aminopeptidase
MERRGVRSLIVFGDSTLGNPDLGYLAGTSIARGGVYLKRMGNPPTLIVSNIDVGSANTGRVRKIKTYSDYGYEKLFSKYDRDEARIRFYRKLVREEGLEGPAVIAGRNDASNTLYLLDGLRRSGLKLVGEKTPTIIEVARETKDQAEIKRLRDVGRRTCWVVKETVKVLRTAKRRGSKLTLRGKELRVGDVRRVIGRLLVEKNLVATEDVIFAPGKGSSDPHYRGEDKDPVRPGEPIVYDIFPSEPDGYWHDCTRTYVYGSPPKKVKEMYDAVLEAQTAALDMVKEGAP